jgi:TetR/AcrR family transcriptional regulator, tetracycline repressor protein
VQTPVAGRTSDLLTEMSVDEASGTEVPRRGRPPSLTKDEIVEAALKLTDESSLDEVSMRAVAGELGVPVMTIYNYVASKEVLNELVVDHVLHPVEVPSPEAGSWDERMRALQRAARRAMRRHPGLSFSRHGSGSHEAARLAEGAMSILREGGFAATQAATAFATLFTFMLGQVELDVLADSGAGGEATFESVTTGIGLNRDQLFETGLDAVIAGITATMGAPTGRG